VTRLRRRVERSPCALSRLVERLRLVHQKHLAQARDLQRSSHTHVGHRNEKLDALPGMSSLAGVEHEGGEHARVERRAVREVEQNAAVDRRERVADTGARCEVVFAAQPDDRGERGCARWSTLDLDTRERELRLATLRDHHRAPTIR
jgi:hypothetical protein